MIATAALSGTVLLPWVVTIPPTGMVFVVPPTLAALSGICTATVTVQLPGVVPFEAGMTPPAIVNEAAPTGAVTTPPAQVVVGAGLAATVYPAPIVVRLSVSKVTVFGVDKGLSSVTVIVWMAPA